MRLEIRTTVAANWNDVTKGFNEELFVALNPPLPKVELLRFDGCKKGDIVSLQLDFLFFKQKWRSRITENTVTNHSFSFRDEGVELPFFLESWKHLHTIQAEDEEETSGTTIIDSIEYKTGTWMTDLLLYPVMLGQFLYRKPIYKKFFSCPSI